jgi:hypothetical protein
MKWYKGTTCNFNIFEKTIICIFSDDNDINKINVIYFSKSGCEYYTWYKSHYEHWKNIEEWEDYV